MRNTYAKGLIVSCFLTFGFYTGSYMRVPVVPVFARELGATIVLVGLINSVFFLTAGFLSLPMGYAADRLGTKTVAASGILLAALTSFLLTFARNPYHIIPIYFLFGLAVSSYGPTMMGYVARVAPPTHVGRAYGWYTTSLHTGISIGPAIGGWIADHFGYHNLFLSSALTLCCFPTLLLLLPEGNSAQPEPPSSKDKLKAKSSPKTVFKHPGLWGCWLITIGLCFGLGTFITFVPLHARDASVPLSLIGVIFLTQGILNALLRIPFGIWSDKTRHRERLILIGVLAVALALVVLGYATSFAVFMIGALLLGSGLALAFTSIGALIAIISPPEHKSSALGGYNAGIYLGFMLASATMGSFIKAFGYPKAFSASGLLILLLACIFRNLTKKA
ncbi:MFS transporter [Thermodesulforhabdus norvegica]|uniref:Predicted arabinose efflux permease, MFS family n=1 Tax=Thermodesulforhabdus norvegica TaxID=39841 RepID=A0A1I4UXI1_9BACT|nr:MFS transporter [Thermodesulforhabdus norvegica]SFM93626.1 Predicted arabinose efflux permease, MFS family [Thermodesulforhabdus norvegica]